MVRVTPMLLVGIVALNAVRCSWFLNEIPSCECVDDSA